MLMEGMDGGCGPAALLPDQGLKTPADTQSEDQLKISLLNLMFGEGKVHVKKHSNGKDYYCGFDNGLDQNAREGRRS